MLSSTGWGFSHSQNSEQESSGSVHPYPHSTARIMIPFHRLSKYLHNRVGKDERELLSLSLMTRNLL